MKLTRKSSYSGIERTLDLNITQEGLDRWQNGEKIQNIFPHLTADEREFIMTGVTNEEWDEMYPPEDELELDVERAFCHQQSCDCQDRDPDMEAF